MREKKQRDFTSRVKKSMPERVERETRRHSTVLTLQRERERRKKEVRE